MATLTEEQVIEIEGQLDCGFRCFWHKKTKELLFVPNIDREDYDDTEFFDEEFDALENEVENYIEIGPVPSRDAFKIMEAFTEQLYDNHLKLLLTNALNDRKPFRKFMFIIHDSGQYRDQWFKFKTQITCQWIRDRFEYETRYGV